MSDILKVTNVNTEDGVVEVVERYVDNGDGTHSLGVSSNGTGGGVSSTLWTDNTAAYFVRVDDGEAVTWTTMAGVASAAPGAGARPADTSALIEGYVDGIEALMTTLNGLVTTQAGYLDGLEGFVDGLEGLTGALTEAAPASDTASSGVNGRLQRVAQRLTSLIALLPASLGAKTAAASFAMTLATDDVLLGRVGEVQASPTANTLLDRLKTIAANIVSSTLALGQANKAGSISTARASDDDGIITDNAAFTDGTTRVIPNGYIFDEVAGTALTENDAGAARMDSKRAQILTIEDETTRGQRLAITAGKAARAVARFIIAVGSTLTRPANQTPYTANDAVSDNATAGSVTAKTVTLSAVNDDPITIEAVVIDTTDTGFQGKNMRMWCYNSDPTASSGVVGGDNAAFSNKKAGFIGTLSGNFRTFSDGAKAVLVPDEGARIVTAPGSGVKTIWWQLQTLDAATSSASSTTFIPTFCGFQGHA